MITLHLHNALEVDAVLMALQRLRRCDTVPNVNGSARGCVAVRLAERLANAVARLDPDYAVKIREWFPLPLAPSPERESPGTFPAKNEGSLAKVPEKVGPTSGPAIPEKIAVLITHGRGV
jgi:hypothetical protein